MGGGWVVVLLRSASSPVAVHSLYYSHGVSALVASVTRLQLELTNGQFASMSFRHVLIHLIIVCYRSLHPQPLPSWFTCGGGLMMLCESFIDEHVL